MSFLYSYILFMVALQFAVYNIQFFTDVLNGAPQIAFMFAVGFISSLLGTAWRGLKAKPLYLSPLILLFLEIGELTYIYFAGPNFISSELKSSHFMDLPELTLMPQSVGIQLLVCFIVSAGIYMNKNFMRFSIRRGATDLDEVTKIYDWKEKIIPSEGDNVFRYQKLLKRAFSLVGVIKNDVASAVHVVRIEDTFFFFDFFVIPEWREKQPSTGKLMIKSCLLRPELSDSSIKTICALVRKEADCTLADYRESGFIDMAENDPLLSDLRSQADKVLSDIYPDWKPLGNASYYLRYVPGR